MLLGRGGCEGCAGCGNGVVQVCVGGGDVQVGV